MGESAAGSEAEQRLFRLISEAEAAGDHEFMAAARAQLWEMRHPPSMDQVWERAVRVVAEHNRHHGQEQQ